MADVDVRGGLLGFISGEYGLLLLDGIVLRRTADGRFALSRDAILVALPTRLRESAPMLGRSGVHPFVAITLLAACNGPQRADRMGFEEARAMFASRGVQPGQPLPTLSLVTLDGAPADIRALQRNRPLVLVTCSLTCNVARRQQAAVNALHQRWGDRIAVIMVYTIDAHPKGDPCPYIGEEWVPGDNERDKVLVRQPTTMAQRMALARQYAANWSKDTLTLVDTMDNASWKALGEAPNLGLCVSGDGIVVQRCGWFDAPQVQKALAPDGG